MPHQSNIGVKYLCVCVNVTVVFGESFGEFACQHIKIEIGNVDSHYYWYYYYYYYYYYYTHTCTCIDQEQTYRTPPFGATGKMRATGNANNAKPNAMLKLSTPFLK